MNHSHRTVLVAVAVCVALLAVAGAGLSAATATGPAASLAPAAGLPGIAGHGGPISMPDGPALPAPEPIALHAEEVEAWIDAVVAEAGAVAADGATRQVTDTWSIIDRCVLADMEGDPATDGDDNSAASIAVAVDGVITYTKGYGVKDVATGGEVDANTLFRIGSTTKMMTAAAILQLVEQGKVSLDAPLPTYLPEFRLGHPWRSEDLTLHRMLSHQTGLVDQYWVGNQINIPLQTWVQVTGAMSRPLMAAPGSFWNYSNPNFSLAGAVVERVAGMPYARYMSANVWDPIGMPLSTVDPTEVISTGNFATGYHGGGALSPADMYMPMLAPAGSAFSTPTELVRWALELQSGTDGVISAASKQLMQSPQINMGYVPWMDYGYGVFLTEWSDAADPTKRVMVYDHGGNIYGGSSQLFWIPEKGVVIAILSNTIRSLGRAAACAVETLGGVEAIPVGDQVVPPEEYGPFTGTYSMLDVLAWPWTAQVSRGVSNTLAVDFSDVPGGSMLTGDRIDLNYAFADVFYSLDESLLTPGSPVEFTFLRDEDDATHVRYMRDRLVVGQRVGEFPARLTVTGTACTVFTVTSGLDMPSLRIETAGIVTPTRLVSLPLTVTNPNDPSSAAIKHDFAVGESGASYIYAVGATEADDAVGLYLLHDADADGQFSWPSEAVAGSISGMGKALLYVTDPIEAGSYQLWVNGLVVAGEQSAVTIDLVAMQGDQMRLEDRPRGLADGVTWDMRVCGDDVGDRSVPGVGMIEYTYDSPPRRFRTMIQWVPEPLPDLGSIYLPLVISRHRLTPR